MTKHYFTNSDNLEHRSYLWQYKLKNKLLHFASDNGVFSKKTVDFGSRLLIENFEATETNGQLLDLGCGYGAIGLALAKTYPALQVDMTDVNLRAIELAKENARLNHIDNVHVFASSVYEQVTSFNYNYIVSNPPIRAGKKIVHQIIEEAYGHLVEGGELWIVIQKKQGAPSVKQKMSDVFNHIEVMDRDKGYFIYRSKKCKMSV